MSHILISKRTHAMIVAAAGPNFLDTSLDAGPAEVLIEISDDVEEAIEAKGRPGETLDATLQRILLEAAGAVRGGRA